MTLIELLKQHPDCAINNVPRHIFEQWCYLYPEAFSHKDYPDLKIGLKVLEENPTLDTWCLRFESGIHNGYMEIPYISPQWEAFLPPDSVFEYRDIEFDDTTACIEDTDFGDEIELLL